MFLGIAKYMLAGQASSAPEQAPTEAGPSSAESSGSGDGAAVDGQAESAEAASGDTSTAGTQTGHASAESSGSGTAQPSMTWYRVAKAASGDTAADELLAEAYVLRLGRYLAGYEEDVFDLLGKRVVDDQGALSHEQWLWIQSKRNVLN